MNLSKLLLPAAALTTAALLVPTSSEAFSLIGSSLSLNQRDIRIFNNFTDTQANNNTAADDQFPGYDGAEMAMWKACVEWGSLPHGDGTGDPSGNIIGSGGANFDVSWQGNATGVGNSNSNTVSELSGSNSGVLAFAEGPYSDGWRVRFYSSWTWNDGPSTFGGGQIDIQGIMTHEYGHCLGLGHSSTSSATMFGSASGNGIADRSIASDDVNGVRAIYGVASASKPIITGINKCDTTLTLLGDNFASAGLEVWFTQSGQGGNGTPVKVFNATSSMGGTEVTVAIPGNAGSGDVLVRNPGTSAANLSNAWPMDIAGDTGSCGPIIPEITSFCFGNGGTSPGCTDCPCGNNSPSGATGGCVNSTGIWAILTATGVQSVSNDTLSFSVFGASPNTFAILSSADNALPNSPTAPCPAGSGVTSSTIDGIRCVGGNLFRHGTRATDFGGENTNPWGPPGGPSGGLIAASGFIAGQVRYFQVFYRDVDTLGCGTGQNTSNALVVLFVP